jgi:hypothetical protein
LAGAPREPRIDRSGYPRLSIGRAVDPRSIASICWQERCMGAWLGNGLVLLHCGGASPRRAALSVTLLSIISSMREYIVKGNAAETMASVNSLKRTCSENPLTRDPLRSARNGLDSWLTHRFRRRGGGGHSVLAAASFLGFCSLPDRPAAWPGCDALV